MISEHSAHSTPQPFGIRTWLWRYTCLLLLISMLWHRQAIFESKGDKLSSSAECRIRTHQGLRHQIASRLNARWQTDWAIEDQAKNLNSTARPYDQRAFSPLDPTAVWHSHLALAIYMFVVVNFDALAQASHIRIERRQVVFLYITHQRTRQPVVLKPSISMSIIMYLPLGSVHTWCTFIGWPFCTKTHTPLELLVPCAKYMVPGHSDRHYGSVSIVVCVSCKSIILQSFIFSHANSSSLLYLSPSPLVLKDTILIIFIKAYYKNHHAYGQFYTNNRITIPVSMPFWSGYTPTHTQTTSGQKTFTHPHTLK